MGLWKELGTVNPIQEISQVNHQTVHTYVSGFCSMK